MMKKLLTFILIGFFCLYFNNISAQISAGANISMFGHFKGGSNPELGLNLFGKYSINEKIRVGANVGYYFQSIDEWGYDTKSTRLFTGLFEYVFNENSFSPYIGADLGIYTFGDAGMGNSNLGVAPVFGFDYQLSDNIFINANIKYHQIMTDGESTSAYGVNAGVYYKF